jgi:hypothetical protein
MNALKISSGLAFSPKGRLMKIAGCVLALVLAAGFPTAYAQDTGMKAVRATPMSTSSRA